MHCSAFPGSVGTELLLTTHLGSSLPLSQMLTQLVQFLSLRDFTAMQGTLEVSNIHLLNYSPPRSIEIPLFRKLRINFSLGDFYKTFLSSLFGQAVSVSYTRETVSSCISHRLTDHFLSSGKTNPQFRTVHQAVSL